ncbi:MAG: hypothetical protein ACLP05_02090 [Candidatus Kryptoniota bacterium]
MINKLSATLTAAFVTVILASTANAQFQKDQNFLGARIGIGSLGSAFSFGADYEYGINNPGDFGPGRVGIGATIDYSHWSDGYWSYTWIPIGVMAYYHLNLDNNKLDPFAGLGLGYEIFNSSWGGLYGLSGSAGYGSGVFFAGQIGIRYFFSPNLAGQARLGFGASLLSVGLDYKF